MLSVLRYTVLMKLFWIPAIGVAVKNFCFIYLINNNGELRGLIQIDTSKDVQVCITLYNT